MATDEEKCGITWGDIRQKFWSFCLEVEEFEETAEYLENQIQIVGESVKQLYLDVMQDLLPPLSCGLGETLATELPIDQYADSESPIDQYADAGFCKKSSQGSEKISVKANTKQATDDSSINHDVDNVVTYAESFDNYKANTKQATGDSSINHEVDNVITFAESFDNYMANTMQATEDSSINHDVDNDVTFSESFDTRRYLSSLGVKSDFERVENQLNKTIHASMTAPVITLSETDTCSTSQSFEFFNENQTHDEDTFSESAYENENLSSEETSNPRVVFLGSAKEQLMNMGSYYRVVLQNRGFSLVRNMQPEECSYNTKMIAHPDLTSDHLNLRIGLNDDDDDDDDDNDNDDEDDNADDVDVDDEDDLLLDHLNLRIGLDDDEDDDDVDVDDEDDLLLDHLHLRNGHDDDELKLEETCVMVTGDELESVPKAKVDLKTSKEKRWQPFSLSKKYARKQEYEELAMWNGKNEPGWEGMSSDMKSTYLTSKRTSWLSDISEPEWELL